MSKQIFKFQPFFILIKNQKNMKPVNLSELSNEELIKKEKTLKTILGAYIGILSIFAFTIMLLFVQKQYTVALPLLAVLLSLSSIMFMSMFTSKK